MERRPVISSSIASIGYDARTMLLEIEFRDSGEVYQYSGVPLYVRNELIAAISVGRYFSAHIRDAYPCVRI
ncbi:KTSC domain-containing protein [Candidatus Solirubrobacter pratensis]|jgi:KTSC domain|uniref:KTSC domain-containing protein n=1 Tax=Candidatus Solirubrobacter pratensis TaxID=1298857 RepID=UPI000421DFD4|nr:KTSC domain-containing protein [Candidatus Solirubrobacter pratensis]